MKNKIIAALLTLFIPIFGLFAFIGIVYNAMYIFYALMAVWFFVMMYTLYNTILEALNDSE